MSNRTILTYHGIIHRGDEISSRTDYEEEVLIPNLWMIYRIRRRRAQKGLFLDVRDIDKN